MRRTASLIMHLIPSEKLCSKPRSTVLSFAPRSRPATGRDLGPTHTGTLNVKMTVCQRQRSRQAKLACLERVGLRVCLNVDDFVPGRDLILEMSRAGRESKSTVCAFSSDCFEGATWVRRSFLDGVQCPEEQDVSSKRVANGARSKVAGLPQRNSLFRSQVLPARGQPKT